MGATHTLGPWSASDVRYNRDFRTCLNVMTKDGLRFVAAVSCDPSSDRQQLEANARLIAAAPDLLEALEEAYAELSADSLRDGPRCLLLTTIEAAISKAKGEA